MATTANAEMAQMWDGGEGAQWASEAEHYERASRLIWKRFLELVPAAANERLLDVGCGNGKSTCDLAAAAPSGSALGIDLSAEMLKNGRRRAAAAALTNVEFVQGDAQVHPFAPASYSLATSVFGAMFFTDPVAAFANIGAALARDGRLALLAWRELPRNEWITVIREAFAAGRDLPMPPTSVPGPFGLADSGRAAMILTDAGFTEVGFQEIDEPSDMGRNEEDAFQFMSSLGLARGLMQDLDDGARGEGLDRLQRAIEDHKTEDGILFRASSWLITARWPGA